MNNKYIRIDTNANPPEDENTGKELIELSSTCKILSTKSKPMEIAKVRRTEKKNIDGKQKQGIYGRKGRAGRDVPTAGARKG